MEKYIVEEYIESDVVRYAIVDNQYKDPIHKTAYQNIILLLDSKVNARMICHILNMEEIEKEEI